MHKSTNRTLILLILFTILLLCLSCVLFYYAGMTSSGWVLPAAVTTLTMFYHFSMRLAVGETVTLLFKKRDFPQNRFGFTLFGFEPRLYRKLNVKRWKTSVITARPEQFDLNTVSPEELLHNVMQAELVHRVIMVLSFVPLLFIIPFGTPAVFIITSVFACLADCVFVIIQRYNRPRVIKLITLAKKPDYWERKK